MRFLWLGLRVFLVLGGLFGLIEGLLQQDVGTGVFAGAVFGLLMAVAAVILTAIRTRGRNISNFSPRQHIVLAVPTAIDEAANRVDVALHQLDPRTVVRDGTRFTARTKVNWWSWGQRLTIELAATDATTTSATITSRPVLPGTVSDYGVAHDVVQAVARAITATTA